MIDYIKQHFTFFAIGFFFFLAVSVTLYDSQMTTDAEEWKTRGDLTEYSLAASKAMLRGEDAYDPSTNPYDHHYKYFPFNATLLVPIALLPIPMAQGLWVALNACMVLFALWCLKELAGREKLHILFWIGAFAIAGRFIIDNIQLGQWNLPVFSLTVIGLWLIIARERPWAGGLLVAMATALKYMPVAFLIYLLARRRWKASIAFALGLILWILIVPSIVWGPSRHMDMLTTFLEKSKHRTQTMMGKTDSAQNSQTPTEERPDKPARLPKYVGHSLLIFIKASLTESEHHAGHGIDGKMNVLNLTPETAEKFALMICFLLALGTFTLTGLGGTARPQLRTLIDISCIFALMLLVSPEARKAQLLTMYVPAFALILTWRSCPKKSFARRISLVGILFCFLVMFLSSDHGDAWEPTQEWLVLRGTWTLYILTFWLACMLVDFSLLKERAGPSNQSPEIS